MVVSADYEAPWHPTCTYPATDSAVMNSEGEPAATYTLSADGSELVNDAGSVLTPRVSVQRRRS